MLIYLYPKRLRGQKLVGTDIVNAIPLTLVAGFGHAQLSHKVSAPVIRNAIAVMLVIVGIKLVL